VEVRRANIHVLLGAGGRQPGITAYEPIAGRLEKVMSFSRGHSVYSISVSPAGDAFVAGTRDGELYWIEQKVEGGTAEGHSMQKHLQGAGVLSSCWLDATTIAASDTAGRCLLWRRGDHRARKLPTAGRTVCSLFKLDGEQLVGLCLEGELLIWNWLECRLVRTLSAPVFHGISALVNIIYWRQASCLVWPGPDGSIVLWNTDSGAIRAVSAHSGPMYAICVQGDMLLTIGKSDGSMKHWLPDGFHPAGSCQAPEGIISASIWADRAYRMLLVSETGQACVYGLSNGGLNFIERLAGHDYRIALGPEPGEFETMCKRHETEEVQSIACRIKEKVKRFESDGLDDLHGRLVELGYEHVSLVLRGEEYRQRKDLVSELGAYNRLAALVTLSDEGARSSLLRYGMLLRTCWQLRTAYDLYKSLAETCPHDKQIEDVIERLAPYVAVIEQNEFVIESEVSIADVIRAATLLGAAFHGQYLVRALEPQGTACRGIVPSVFIEKYEHMRLSNSGLSLPRAEEKSIWWLSKDRIEMIPTVVFSAAGAGPAKGLEFGIQFRCDELQTTLVPVVLFRVDPKKPNVGLEQHNSEALAWLQLVYNRSLSNGWLSIVHGCANQVVRQLITKELSHDNILCRAIQCE